jgi:hypothetical protein
MHINLKCQKCFYHIYFDHASFQGKGFSTQFFTDIRRRTDEMVVHFLEKPPTI